MFLDAIGSRGFRLNTFYQVLVKDSLPRTASNKVMRRVLRDELKTPASKL